MGIDIRGVQQMQGKWEVHTLEDKDNRTPKGGSKSNPGRGTVSTAKRSGSTGSASRAAASRPKSATAQERSRTSTGRPLDAGRTSSQNKTAPNRQAHSSTGTSRRAAGASGARQRRTDADRHGAQRPSSKKPGSKTSGGNKKGGYALDPVKVMGAAVILGLVLALIITLIMRASMLRSHQIQTDYNVGDVFDINNYFAAGSSKAKIEYDNAEFEPDELGEYTVRYKVVRGKMSKTKKGKINIVDDVSPYISGPDTIEVTVGSEINWADYYSVTDEDPDIQGKLKASPEVDTSKTGVVDVTLTVSDWAGNTSTKKITVDVN